MAGGISPRMNQPSLEMADIVHSAGDDFIKRSRRWISWQHQKVLLAITRCRTAALGGHRDQCSSCGHSAISYYSCRNRHCPGCQGNARVRWLEARQRELLARRADSGPSAFQIPLSVYCPFSDGTPSSLDWSRIWPAIFRALFILKALRPLLLVNLGNTSQRRK